MNKRRLLKLADLLMANANNPKGVKFDLDGWGRLGGNKITLDCQTTACAVGLACISPEFPELKPMRAGLNQEIIYPTLGKYQNWVAVQKFFGISCEQSKRLFSMSNYPASKHKGAAGERAVAYRIRRMVAAA